MFQAVIEYQYNLKQKGESPSVLYVRPEAVSVLWEGMYGGSPRFKQDPKLKMGCVMWGLELKPLTDKQTIVNPEAESLYHFAVE